MPIRLRKQDKVELLAGLPLFVNCTRRELGDIAAITVEAERRAGTYLTRQGQDGGLLFVLVEGRAEVVASADPDGSAERSRLIGELRAGDVVGELSLIDGKPRSASVRALTDVRLLEINSEDFHGLVGRSPRFVRNLLRALTARVREADSLAP